MANTTTSENKTKKIPWKPIVLGVLVIALFAAWRILPMETWLTRFNDWVAGLGTAGMIVYGLFYILAIILLVPGALTTIGAGFLFGLGWGTLVVSLSATTAAAISFLIARYLARDMVAERVQSHDKFNAIDRAIGKEGGKIVGLLRLSPALPFSFSNYLFGLTAVRFWPYVFATWLGTLPGTVMYVYIGAAGKASLEAATEGTSGTSTAEQIFFVVGLLATVAVTIFVTRIAKKALKETEVEETT